MNVGESDSPPSFGEESVLNEKMTTDNQEEDNKTDDSNMEPITVNSNGNEESEHQQVTHSDEDSSEKDSVLKGEKILVNGKESGVKTTIETESTKQILESKTNLRLDHDLLGVQKNILKEKVNNFLYFIFVFIFYFI